MFKKIYDKKNDILIIQRNIFLIISIILLFIDVLLSIYLTKRDTNIVLVPFGIEDKISLSTKRLQNNYLEAISRDVINTILNLTPENVGYAEKIILSFADSKGYGSIKNQFKEIKENIVSKKVTTAFYPLSIQCNNKNLTVIVEGVLYNYLGQREISNNKKKYEIRYSYRSGRLTILGFSEVIEEKNTERE